MPATREPEAPDLETIDAALAGRAYMGRLSPGLERLYRTRTARFRRRLVAMSLRPTLVIYNGFLVVDFVLVRDVVGLAVLLHAAVSLLIVAVSLAYRRLPDGRGARWLLTAMPLGMVAQIMAIFALSKEETRLHYQYFAVMIVVYSNVNQRHGTDFARAVSLSAFTVYMGALLRGGAPAPVIVTGGGLMGAARYLTTAANARFQRDERFAFLQQLRQEALHVEAEHRSLHDPLTGLGNRRRLMREARRIAQEGGGRPLSVLMIDLDRFKAYNDALGHGRGDDCLRRVAGMLASGLRRKGEAAFRYGGEEFVVLAEGTDAAGATAMAERLCTRIVEAALPHPANPPWGIVTASVGTVTGTPDETEVDALLEAADEALYRAKAAGRNAVRAD